MGSQANMVALILMLVVVYDVVVVVPRHRASTSGAAEESLEVRQLRAEVRALRMTVTDVGVARGPDSEQLKHDQETALQVVSSGIHNRLGRIEATVANVRRDQEKLRSRRTVTKGSPRATSNATATRGSSHEHKGPLNINWRNIDCRKGQASTRPIPRSIVQMWKSHTDARATMARRVWSVTHPCYDYKIINNSEAWSYLRTRWPDMIPYFEQTSNVGEKADLLRYLWMYDHGGIYADMDAVPLQSLDELLGDGRTFVVGLEADFKTEKLRDDWLSGAMRSATLHCFASSKNNPILWKVIQKVIVNLKEPLRLDRLMEGRSSGDITTIRTLHRTGPVPFSEVVLNDKSSTLLGVLALQGGHGAGSRYYKMMRPETLASGVPKHKMNQVYVTHVNSGTWLPDSGVLGPPGHVQVISRHDCLKEHTYLDIADAESAEIRVGESAALPFTLPAHVKDPSGLSVMVRSGLFILDGQLPVAIVHRAADADEEAKQQRLMCAKSKMPKLVATLDATQGVSKEHVKFMSDVKNALPWCREYRQPVCQEILHCDEPFPKSYSKEFVDKMQRPWERAWRRVVTTFPTAFTHLLTDMPEESATDNVLSANSFSHLGESSLLQATICVDSSTGCVVNIAAEYTVEGWRGGHCSGNTEVQYVTPSGDCVTMVRVRERLNIRGDTGCVQQVQFGTRKGSTSRWLGASADPDAHITEKEAQSPTGFCLANLWGGIEPPRPSNSLSGRVLGLGWLGSQRLVGLGVTFGPPMPVVDPERSRLCVVDDGIELFGREKTLLKKWKVDSGTDNVRLLHDRIVVDRTFDGISDEERLFMRVRAKMKIIAKRTKDAMAKDVGGKRFFPEKRGIVMVTGEGNFGERPAGIHFSMTYGHLNWLYHVVNTTLPTELWIMTAADYPVGLNMTFPLVRIRVLAETSIRDWYDETLPGNFFTGLLSYNAKILAVLASSFAEPIVMDNDNFPLVDPARLFDHDFYRSDGHVMWADAQPMYLNNRTTTLLGLNHTYPGDEILHSDGGQIAFDRRKYLPGIAAMFHVGIAIGETDKYFYGDKDLWRFAFMYQHQASPGESYFVPGTFRHVVNYPSWFGYFDFRVAPDGWQRKFHIGGYAQYLHPSDSAPAFMHFSGGAKLLLLDSSLEGFKRSNLWSHWYRITDDRKQLRKDMQPVRDLGWCTESDFDVNNILPMPHWLEIQMDWLRDRLAESQKVYPIRGLKDFIALHTMTATQNGCFR